MLKGTAEGILLKPRSQDWEAVLRAIHASLEEAADFFRGGRLIMELGNYHLPAEQLIAIRALLRRYDIELWAILSNNEKTIHTTRSYGILTRLPKEPEAPRRQEREEETPENRGMFVQRTLRSGQKLQYAGHVTILGDVNPGAEVVAGGNIIVWGRLRGVAHAGAYGDTQVMIGALELQPAQLRIAGYFARTPEAWEEGAGPEVARIREGSIYVEPWSTRG